MPHPADLRITRVDPTDDLALRDWYDVERGAMLLGREQMPHWSYEEMSTAWRRPDPGEDARGYAAYADGRMVGGAVLYMPVLDNLDKCWLGVCVRPDDQHAGVGRALLSHVEAEAVAAGRTELLAESKIPFAETTFHRHRRFAEQAGYGFSNIEVVRHLGLPVDEAELAGWTSGAAAKHEGYRIETHVNAMPEHLLASLCVLHGQLGVDAPTGEAEWEEEQITPERYLANLDSLVAAGRTIYETVAIAPDGTVAAQTTMSVPPPGRTDVSQWGTFVHREHRGHRLGLAVKAANLRAVQDAHPQMRRVVTQNAETNQWMIAINEQIGFAPVEASMEFIKRI
ncbi:GNAT family N-acetyltransferase [Nocardioides sp. R-C-SC26]|uniref:GNAT family N-acetyltransferase n=1 Tax=Nocardioides sp. R-C-SC26 TaxID=2870414 RepID=UPI001E4A11AF|nr:GNAT family N-acetyltransferase [Nocardioides sp. R-C-SC26]